MPLLLLVRGTSISGKLTHCSRMNLLSKNFADGQVKSELVTASDGRDKDRTFIAPRGHIQEKLELRGVEQQGRGQPASGLHLRSKLRFVSYVTRIELPERLRQVGRTLIIPERRTPIYSPQCKEDIRPQLVKVFQNAGFCLDQIPVAVDAFPKRPELRIVCSTQPECPATLFVVVQAHAFASCSRGSATRTRPEPSARLPSHQIR